MAGTLGQRIRRLRDSGILVRVTNLGLGFVLTTLVVAIGASNTGNNGLYILLSLFLSVLVVSGVVSRRNVEEIDVQLEGPQEIFAGEPVRFTVRLANRGRFAKNAILVKVSGKAAPILFHRIGPREESSRGVDLVFPRRGRHVVESLLVFSAFPIGLFRKGRLHPVREERIVFPAPSEARVPPPDAISPADDAIDPRRRGRGPEVLHLRDAVPGDDPRDIHWPQTARQGRPIVKERAADSGQEALLVVDAHRPSGPGDGWDAAFESALQRAAGLALRFLARGDRVGLVLGGSFIPPAVGPSQRRSLLTALALASPDDGPSLPIALPPGAVLYRVRPAA